MWVPWTFVYLVAGEPLRNVGLDRYKRMQCQGFYLLRRKSLVAGEKNSVHIHWCSLVSGMICTVLHKRMETWKPQSKRCDWVLKAFLSFLSACVFQVSSSDVICNIFCQNPCKARGSHWEILFWCSLCFAVVWMSRNTFSASCFLLSQFVKAVTLLCGERLCNRVKSEKRIFFAVLRLLCSQRSGEAELQWFHTLSYYLFSCWPEA